MLLDTHILLWWATADRRLKKAIRAIIAADDSEVSVSAVSFWEIAIKRALGRIEVDLAELQTAVHDDAFEEVPLRIAHSVQLQSIPDRHGDPFDRMLIAQAIVEGRRLITSDNAILGYAGIAGFNPLPA